MIPTTATSSSLSTPSPSTPTTVSSSQQNLTMAFKGIAALILEGRAISEDEYQTLHAPSAVAMRPSPIVVNAGAYKDHVDHLSLFHSSSSSGGRRSPGPSTSRAAASSTFNSTTSRHAINITTNPHVFVCLQSPLLDDVIEDSTFTETSTHQRWTQKLCQLRQASPASTMTRDCRVYEQQVGIEVGEPELVALAINSDTANTEKAGDYEIVRRVVMNRSNLSNSGGSASSSPGSTENFLHSLQSLATTCLRGGSPAVETGIRYMGPNTAAFGSVGAPKNSIFRATTPPAPRCSIPFGGDVPGSASSSGSGIQSPYSNCNWSPQPITTVTSGSGSVSTRCNRRDQFKVESSAKEQNITTPTSTRNASVGGVGSKLSNSSMSKSAIRMSSYPQQGPHCEQFLRKMGLAKGDAAEAEEHFCDMSYVNITCSRWRAYCLKMEAIIQRGEPVCIEVYLGPVRHKILLEQWILSHKDKAAPPNMTLPSLCSAIRSQLYFSQISAWCDLIKKSDKTIFDTERVIFPTATGAAGDLAISNTSPTVSTTVASSSASSSPNSESPPSLLSSQRRPRLNIFYRIKQYDSTACFNTKPNVHNFPSVIIGDGCSISVCLKSLPRINGGIPKLGAGGAAISNGAVADFKTNATASAFEDVVSTPPTSISTLLAKPTTSRQELTTGMATAVPPKTICDTQKASAAAADSVASSSKTSSSRSSDSFDAQNKAHKCMFFIDEEDLPADEQTYEDDDDDCTNGSFGGDSSNSSFSCSLSHREKQLLKYRKRMLKRDKKTTRKSSLTSGQHVQHMASNGNRSQPMEQGDEDEHEEEVELESKYNGRNSHPDCPPSEEESITQNSSSRHGSISHSVAMVSTGTQTQSNCYNCGSEKALVCLTCDSSSASSNFKGPSNDDMDSMDSCSISSSDLIHTPRNNAELLLQAIQRTPKAAKKNKKQSLRASPPSTPVGNGFNNKESKHATRIDASNSSKPESQNRLAGCQLCKRQKTQHNFESDINGVISKSGATGDSEQITCDEDEEEDDGRPNVETVPSAAPVGAHGIQQKPNTTIILEKECFLTSTKLTPYVDKCSLNNNINLIKVSGISSASALKSSATATKMRCDEYENNTTANNRSCTPPNNSETANTINATANGNSTSLLFIGEGSFKTPPTTNAHQQSTQNYPQHKQTPKPTLLQFSAPYHGGAAGDGNEMNGGGISNFAATPPPTLHNPLLLRKGLPKVNLTPIFCNPSTTATVCHSSCFTSSPIPISSCPSLSSETSFCFDHVAIAAGGAHSPTISVDNNNITVQKSYSAPALPNSSSPSLSPRFSKQAAIYKRRSRHLSDRSDRSSLGSDEQISDEDLECATGGLYSPATSPMKMRSRTAALFGGRALLGNLEESLLQRRLLPKVEVFGFKVLLGASGGFCPTQLTIPASSYFYELQGAALSTPYVCEIRLPRKGYSVPRAGTVQATLLNPMGTVVRMFVIPYDMRDMPPLHQTFIRQRVLAEASSNEVIEADKNGASNCVGGVASGGSSSNNNYNNNNSVDYQNGVENGFSVDAAPSNKDCASNTTNCTDNNSSNYNNNINNNNNNNGNRTTGSTSVNNKYRLSPNGGLHGDSNLGHFISAEHMKRLRYSIHLRFQTSRSGRLSLHTDIRLLISRRTDCDTAAAHAKGVLEAPNDLVTDTVMPSNPKYSARQENPTKI